MTKGHRYRVRLSQALNAKLLDLCARWGLEPESVFRRLLEEQRGDGALGAPRIDELSGRDCG